jgi:hypothetical protein
MLTRLRCLIRLHRWQPITTDEYGRFKQCGDCPKWKRIDKNDGKHYRPPGSGYAPWAGG